MRKEQKNAKGKGWHEKPDLELGKAIDHSDAAKKAYKKKMQEGAINEPIETAKGEDISIPVRKESTTELEKYITEHRLSLEIEEREGDTILVGQLPAEKIKKFATFLKSIDAGAGAEEEVESILQYPRSQKIDDVIKAFIKKHGKELGDSGIGAEEDKDCVNVSVPAECVSAFRDFAKEQGLTELDSESEEEQTTADEIVETIQSKRKSKALAKDNAQTAKQIGRKENTDDLLKWVKDPGKSDLVGVDTKGAADLNE